jgi:hypothetical protein
MGLQPLVRERPTFKINDKRYSGTAVEGEFGTALHVALQGRGRSTLDRLRAGLSDHNRIVFYRDLAEP